MTAERSGIEKGEMTLWREERMTLMASGVSAAGFHKKHELNIAEGQSSGTGYGASR